MSYTVCITGGTGSFGQAMTRLILNSSDWKVRVLSRSEYPQVKMRADFNDPRVTYMLGDVRDLDRLRLAFNNCDLVLHAAALKHVPVGESNPEEVVQVNINGTRNVVRAARDCGVHQALLISSDKAVHPINLYGSTKLTAEKLFIGSNQYTAGDASTRYNVVRYGNVMGSRGSVLEIWRRAISERRRPLLTHPDMTRFWFEMKEALHFVLWCAAENHRGSIFVPHMAAFDMVDLMHALLDKTTLVVGQDYDSIGVRTGEKMHEHILTPQEVQQSYTFLHATSDPEPNADGQMEQRGAVYAHAVVPKDVDWEVPDIDARRWRPHPEILEQTRSSDWPHRLSVEDIRERLKTL